VDRQPVGNPTREVDGQVFSEPPPAPALMPPAPEAPLLRRGAAWPA